MEKGSSKGIPGSPTRMELLEAEVDAEWAEGGECNAVDLTEEMDEARTVAEALCAPATLS